MQLMQLPELYHIQTKQQNRPEAMENVCSIILAGTPSIFFMVTPDDDNSFLIQVVANDTVDDNVPMESSIIRCCITQRAMRRTNLRIK